MVWWCMVRGMGVYRKKAVAIEAVQFTGQNIDEVGSFLSAGTSWIQTPSGGIIPTLEGDMSFREGDWIIRGVEGEYYPCKPSVFEASYEPTDYRPMEQYTAAPSHTPEEIEIRDQLLRDIGERMLPKNAVHRLMQL